MDFLAYLKQVNGVKKSKIDKFIEILSTYEENDVMYMGIIEELFDEDEREILLPPLEEEGYLDKIYIVQCPYCNNLGNTYVEYEDIPSEVDYCRYCDTEFSYQENYIEAYRIKFNYNNNTDVIAEINDKIEYNKTRLAEVSNEMKELENTRRAIQTENINLITSKNRMLAFQQNSKTYEEMMKKYPNAHYIGITDGPNIYAKCGKCSKEFELYQMYKKIIGICPECGTEVDFTGYDI